MSETKPDLTLSLQETANSIEIQAADGTIVADLINEADCCVTESMRQYAALFAAAPDMLAALKAAHKLLNHMGDILNGMDAVTPEDQEMATPIFEQIRAAIAKAGTQ